jgi:Eukaryotic aspartyl protease
LQATQKLIPQKLIGVNLQRLGESTDGEISFGVSDDTKFSGLLALVPVLNTGFWEVPFVPSSPAMPGLIVRRLHLLMVKPWHSKTGAQLSIPALVSHPPLQDKSDISPDVAASC